MYKKFLCVILSVAMILSMVTPVSYTHLLGAIFMATDYVTTPTTKMGHIIFGIGSVSYTHLAALLFARYCPFKSFLRMIARVSSRWVSSYAIRVITKTKSFPCGRASTKMLAEARSKPVSSADCAKSEAINSRSWGESGVIDCGLMSHTFSSLGVTVTLILLEPNFSIFILRHLPYLQRMWK